MAYSLLRVGQSPTNQEIERFGRTIKTVRLSSGSHRTTYAGRFRDLDELATSVLKRTFAPNYPLRIYDLGTSDALACSEWARTLLSLWTNSTVVASDHRLYLIEGRRSNREAVIFEPGGTPLQFIRPPFVVALDYGERWIYFGNRLMSWWGTRLAEPLCNIVRGLSWDPIFDSRVQRVDGWEFRQISLLHPSARALMRSSARFRIQEHDAFNELAEPCEVLRILNLYNEELFTSETITDGLRAAFRSLTDGGMLILGRTVEDGKPRNEVSIFTKRLGAFTLVERLGGGSELEQLVLSRVP